VVGIKTKFWIVAVFYLVVLVVMFVIGRCYEASGAPQFLARKANNLNPEFMKILADLEEIKNKPK